MVRWIVLFWACLFCSQAVEAVPRFRLPDSGPKLDRPVKPGTHYDAVGEKAGVYGIEAGLLEAWLYPIKVLGDFRLSFRPAGWDRDITESEVAQRIVVRPESVVLVYAHPLFSVEQILFVPHDRPGAILLLDVASREPVRITASFLPEMRPMWPAPAAELAYHWDAGQHSLALRAGAFTAALAAPGWQYQPPVPPGGDLRKERLTLQASMDPRAASTEFLALALAPDADAAASLLANAAAAYQKERAYYAEFLASTVSLDTPDSALDDAFLWARLAIHKGLADTPGLGRGLIAGYRASLHTERPGFAWYFGRDSAWSSLALNSFGDFASTRAALDFLRRYQRADGKIPHEVSQSANLVPWFSDFPYPWASADSTPLFIIAHGDYWRASGDAAYIRQAWPSLRQAYRYSLSMDGDGNHLLDNDLGGHGWVEGGKLLPAHEEIYLQGVWVEALRSLADMADSALDKTETEPGFADQCRKLAEQVRARIERTYWVAGNESAREAGYYAFATRPGGSLTPDITVMPAVPMWWNVLDERRGREMLEHIAGSGILSDWGTRILTQASPSYDPTSYHYGSVWPLFTGWATMAAYRYGRGDLGWTLLQQNARLTFDNALGYVTELLSGDFYVPTTESTHHQIWSSAMVATPAVRGLMGIYPNVPAATLRLEPQLPPAWKKAAARAVPFGSTTLDIEYTRTPDGLTAAISGPKLAGRVILSVRGPWGTKEQSAELRAPRTIVALNLPAAPQAWADPMAAELGASSRGLRVQRSELAGHRLVLTLEGRPGIPYRLEIFRARRIVDASPARVLEQAQGRAVLEVSFGDSDSRDYARRTVTVRFAAAARAASAAPSKAQPEPRP